MNFNIYESDNIIENNIHKNKKDNSNNLNKIKYYFPDNLVSPLNKEKSNIEYKL